MEDRELVINADGTVQAVYGDDLGDLFAGDVLLTRRASHVEPHPTRPGWLADLSPVGGPLLGQFETFSPADVAADPDAVLRLVTPFATRQAALDAEIAWLRGAMERGPIEASIVR